MKHAAGLFADVVNGADADMMQRRSRARFALERSSAGVARYIAGQEFEPDNAPQARFSGSASHPALLSSRNFSLRR